MSIAFFLGLATLFVAMGASASYFGGLLREHMFSLTKAGGIIVFIFGIMTLFGKGFSGAGFQGRPASTFLVSFFSAPPLLWDGPRAWGQSFPEFSFLPLLINLSFRA